MRKFLFILVVLLAGIKAQAKDLGTFGYEFAIAERDLLRVIEDKLDHYENNKKLESFNKKYREKIKEQIKRPSRVPGIANATEGSIRKFDPTVELEEDILVPKEGSEVEYDVLYAAGTKINPLDYMEFDEPLVFIDGNIEAQKDFAKKYQIKNPLALIVLIDGSPEFDEAEGIEYYFDQWGAYSQLFGISAVPSVIYQMPQEKVLTIREVRVE